jgi:hypothetical protein
MATMVPMATVGTMRKLWLFSLLCLSAAALLASWLAAYLLAAGSAVRAFGSWMLLDLLLLCVLLPLGFLSLPFLNRMERRYGPVTGAIRSYFVLAGLALACATVTTVACGPQMYHARYGERAEALITETAPVYDDDNDRRGTKYRVVAYDTGRDLGWMERGPKERAAEGERIEISVDPHGWLDPVAAERLGYTTVPTAILVCCLAAATLAALAIVGAGLLYVLARA